MQPLPTTNASDSKELVPPVHSSEFELLKVGHLILNTIHG